MEEATLFNASILERLSILKTDNSLIVRPLKTTDYDKGFPQILNQLTEVGNVSKEQFLNVFWKMKASGSYYVIVIEDVNNDKVIGCATLVLEQKFIHNCALRGRVEDVVVNKEYRGKQLGKLVVTTLSKLAQHLNCYKLSLDCRDALIPFYESLGFKKEHSNANSLNMRLLPENTQEQSHL
ncbi:probable glucosamine 6-phosphate N-acetyltransferase isoform X2 [Orussus abietinus]|nr:probable glucosamine 6-phosphate N-acetyltransferase isoform X2 [Orussus abietinus]